MYYFPENPIQDYKVQNALVWIRGKLGKLTWDELIRIQTEAPKEDKLFVILEMVEYYVNNVVHGSYGYKLNLINAIRSFFSWNRQLRQVLFRDSCKRLLFFLKVNDSSTRDYYWLTSTTSHR